MADERAYFNPYPGLRPYGPDENYLFFGRDGQSDELLRRLRRNRFVAVVGTSGSGKSSLVRAGLLPDLQSGMMAGRGSRWRIALFQPRGDPIGNLAAALCRPGVLMEDTDEAVDLTMELAFTRATLQRSALGIVDAYRQANLAERPNLLVVVDQFEELFRFKDANLRAGAADEAAAFVKLLLAATTEPEVPAYVIITMRSDFLGDCTQFRDLPETINDTQYLIPRMTRDERRAAITGPAAVGGASLTPRLVQRLLNDMGDNPDQLPILQHALMRTWDHWRTDRGNGEPLDLPDYEAIGGMEKALSRHADEAFSALARGQQEDVAGRRQRIAEKMFKFLTEKGDNNREIRRPAKLADIAAVADADPREVVSVIDVFRAPECSFLMPSAGTELADDTLIDISHESLIRNWRKLKTWVDEEGRSAYTYRRLADTALMHREEEAGLYRNPDLRIALDWREKQQPNAAWARRYHPAFDEAMDFLEQSRQAVEAEEAAREAQARRELEAEKEKAETQARYAQRMRRLVWVSASLAVIAAVFGIFSINMAEQAETMERLGSLYQKALVPEREYLDGQPIDLDALEQVADHYRQPLKNLDAEYSTRVFLAVQLLRDRDGLDETRINAAMDNLERALVLVRRWPNNPRREARVHEQLGFVYSRLDDVARARSSFESAIELYARAGERSSAASLYGPILRDWPPWKEASAEQKREFASLVRKAVGLQWEIGRESGLTDFAKMAKDFDEQAEFAKAENILRAVAETYERHKDDPAVAAARFRAIDRYLEIGYLYLEGASRAGPCESDKEPCYAGATRNFEAALAKGKEYAIGPGFEPELLARIGYAYLRAFLKEEAEKYFGRIHKVVGTEKHDKARVLRRVARWYRQQGNEKEAQGYELRAMASEQISVFRKNCSEPSPEDRELTWCTNWRDPDLSQPMLNAATRGVELTGHWTGEYSYRCDGSNSRDPATPFALNVSMAPDGTLGGYTVEPNTFGNLSSAFLYARIEAIQNGNQLRFVKTYDGTGGQTHKVCYQGTIDDGAGRITGQWYIGNRGHFFLRR